MPSQNTIICYKCKSPKGTTHKRYNSLVQKFGSVKLLKKGYVCRECKVKKITFHPAQPGKTNKGISNKKTSTKISFNKIVCSKCKNVLGTTPTRTKKLISKFGSIEELYDKYVCRTCRKHLNVDRRGKQKRVRQKRVPKTFIGKRIGNNKYILPASLCYSDENIETKEAWIASGPDEALLIKQIKAAFDVVLKK